MLKGTVTFRTRIKSDGVRFPLVEFNPHLPRVDKVEIEAPNGYEILATIHWEPRDAGRGWSDNHHRHDAVESLKGNMGEPTREVKESECRVGNSGLRSSEVRVSSQCGHSSRRARKSRTGRRATA